MVDIAKNRRKFLQTSTSLIGLGALGGAGAQSFPFSPNQRYPDPSVLVLDPSFLKYRIYSSTVEQLATGYRWIEGPVYFPKGGYLLFSDIPNQRIMKFDEATGKTTVFRENSNYANGNTKDLQGRLITCEHSNTRRVTRTEFDGKITVLADNYQGKKLNAPNDVVCKSDGTIWFTDPLFGISGDWEGIKAPSEQATTNVYRIEKDGTLTAVITDIFNPNGLAFSPDEKKLYVVEARPTPNRSIWSFDVAPDGSLSNKVKFYDAADQGALDGFRVDKDGNLWCGYGSNGLLQTDPTSTGTGRPFLALRGKSEDLDGVLVLNPQAKPIGFIKLPERCANLTFGGPKNNRLYMTSSHSLYALYVEAHAAVY